MQSRQRIGQRLAIGVVEVATNAIDVKVLLCGLDGLLHLERCAHPNGVGHVHALHADLLHQARQVSHTLGGNIAFIWATHGATHRATHGHARRQSSLHHGRKALDALGDGTVDVFAAERFAGRAKHHDFVGLRFGGRFKALQVGREHRVTHAALALDARHDFGVVRHLRHPLGGHKTRDLDLGQACGLKSVHQFDLDRSGHRLFFVLQSVAGADIDELNARRQ